MLELALAVQMVVAMEGLVSRSLGLLLLLGLTFVFLVSLLLTFLLFFLLLASHPRHHDVLLMTFVPSSPAVLLLEGPDIHQSSALCVESVQDGAHGFYTAFGGRQMVQHGDTDGKIKMVRLMWQRQNIGNDGGVRLMRGCDLGK